MVRAVLNCKLPACPKTTVIVDTIYVKLTCDSDGACVVIFSETLNFHELSISFV
jgi:hypothetical protein